MPLVDVKKQNKHNSEEKALAKRRRSEVPNWGNWDPFAFSVTPADFFSASPFALMRSLSTEMDRAFGRFFGQGRGDSSATWVPAIEVTEHGQLQVHAELPGLKPEDVKIEVTDDSLIIQGERKYEHEEKKKGFVSLRSALWSVLP